MDTCAAKKMTHTNTCFAIVSRPLNHRRAGYALCCIIVVDGPDYFEYRTVARECYGMGNLIKHESKTGTENVHGFSMFLRPEKGTGLNVQNLEISASHTAVQSPSLLYFFCAKLDSPGIYTGRPPTIAHPAGDHTQNTVANLDLCTDA